MNLRKISIDQGVSSSTRRKTVQSKKEHQSRKGAFAEIEKNFTFSAPFSVSQLTRNIMAMDKKFGGNALLPTVHAISENAPQFCN